MNKIALVFIFVFATSAQAMFDSEHLGVVEKFVDDQSLIAVSDQSDWNIGEILAIVSQNSRVGTIGFVEVAALKQREDGKNEIKMNLQRQSRTAFVQVGDFIRRLDLSSENSDYFGTTELLIRDSEMNISSKYRPLVYQGFVIGDTAQTLYEKEFLINYFGNIYYGATPNLTVGTLAPVNVLGQPNANFRYKFYDSETTTITSGLSFTRITKDDQASLNMNFYWDNTSTGALISHTFLGLGVVRWDQASDAASLKYLTSSSFQTGYEVIQNDWDRFLIGPSYNFEKKALGGYLSYIFIRDRFHLQISINASDITHLRLAPTDGYYPFMDIFWRF